MSQDKVSHRKDAKTQSQIDHKQRMQYTPQNTPDKCRTATHGSGSFTNEMKMQQESIKRKASSLYNESPEKIRKTAQSGKFINTLIGQWSKHMGMQTPVSLIGGANESPLGEEAKHKHIIEERKIEILQKKLQNAEESISSLSASHEAELQAKEEILTKLSANWESIDIITKYCNDISESLAGFQQHHANLSSLYNNIITAQQSVVKKLQQELQNVKLKDEENIKAVTDAENKVENQEKRIQEMILIKEELKKQLADTEEKLSFEKHQLQSVHAEEISTFMKERDQVILANEKLHLQLKEMEQDQQNVPQLLEQKDKHISKLQEEVSTCKNKIEDLLCQNSELTINYNNLVKKEEDLLTQIKLKHEEAHRLRENLHERQKIEADLIQDIKLIENNFIDQKEQYKNLQTKFTSIEKQLKETQFRNVDLENRLQDMRSDDERKIDELNKKLEFLEAEKRKILLENQTKFQTVESSYKSLHEKHETTVSALEKEFQVKLAEMEQTIATQNSAYKKLSEGFNKINEENQSLQAKIYDMKECNEKLQNELENRLQPIVQSETTETENIYENRIQAVEQNFKSMQDVIESTLKQFGHKKTLMHDEQENLYNFNTPEVNNTLQKIASPLKQQKRRFNLSSPKENLSCSSQVRSASQIQSNPISQLEEHNRSQVVKNSSQQRKFFKSRGTEVKQYGKTKK